MSGIEETLRKYDIGKLVLFKKLSSHQVFCLRVHQKPIVTRETRGMKEFQCPQLQKKRKSQFRRKSKRRRTHQRKLPFSQINVFRKNLDNLVKQTSSLNKQHFLQPNAPQRSRTRSPSLHPKPAQNNGRLASHSPKIPKKPIPEGEVIWGTHVL